MSLGSRSVYRERSVVGTPPRGWTAMRAALNFDGSARELLADMAGDGGAVIFVDNLDFFTPEERNTVVDLIRWACESE